MLFVSNKKLITALMMAATLPGVSWAGEAASPVEQRVDRLERIIQGQGLMNLITRVDQLQNEVQRLNGDNETLRHELKQMQDRQRQMYIDLDERLLKAESAVPATSSAPQTSMDTTTSTDTSTVTNTAATTTDSAATMTGTADTSAPVAVENGEAAYQQALQTLRSGQYEQAVQALAAFPEKYPNSIYLPNAYYWQGEAKYVLRDFANAAGLFQIVIDQYPDSTKVPDALLKRGFSEYEMGDQARAVQTLQSVIATYPDSSAARLAKGRLDRISQ